MKTLAVGAYGIKGHARAEWFDSDDLTWSKLDDSPVGQRYSDFCISAVGAEFYLFGGYAYNLGYQDSTVISRFSSGKWQLVGELTTKRKGHNVIVKDSQFWIVGGQGSFKTEVCSITGDRVSCDEHGDQKLQSYSFYPEMFIVPYNFCL